MRDDKFKKAVKSLSKTYRKLIEFDENAVIEIYKEEKRAELGRYRHNNVYVNYDNLMALISKEWEPKNHALCQEIIHNVSNKVNDLILKAIIKAERELSAAGQVKPKPRINNNKNKENV